MLVQTMHDYGVGRDVALSMIVSHGKACGIVFGAPGWPYDGVAFADKNTNLRQVVEFVYQFGFRLTWSAMIKDDAWAVAK